MLKLHNSPKNIYIPIQRNSRMTEKYKAKRLKKIQAKNMKRKHEHNKYIERLKDGKI